MTPVVHWVCMGAHMFRERVSHGNPSVYNV